MLNPLSANPKKWPNTLRKFVGKLSTNCLSVFDHFVKLALKWLMDLRISSELFSRSSERVEDINLRYLS